MADLAVVAEGERLPRSLGALARLVKAGTAEPQTQARTNVAVVVEAQADLEEPGLEPLLEAVAQALVVR